MAAPKSGLDDPEHAAFAWSRYRRIMAWMTAVAGVCVILALIGLEQVYGPLSLTGRLATMLGVGGSVMMAAALMGLTFLSSGTGHDEAVDERD